jgi:hypothetical protein
MCCYDKSLLNVAAYVVRCVCVCVCARARGCVRVLVCVCVCGKQEPAFGVYCNVLKVFIAFAPTVVATFRVDVRWKWAFVQVLQW